MICILFLFPYGYKKKNTFPLLTMEAVRKVFFYNFTMIYT